MHAPLFAGRYYFADAGRLRASVESYIEDSMSVRADGQIVALIVPHAPHTECGPVAGFAYKMLLTTPLIWDSVTLLAASATTQAGELACDPADAYDLPTEPVPVDQLACAALCAALHDSGISIAAQPDDEPLVESHLPFVQVALGDVPVVPLRVGVGVSASALNTVAQQLGLVIGIANLPPGFEQAACDAIERLDVAFFAGEALAAKSKGLAGLFGVKPVRLSPSPDAAALALTLSVARANGATTARVLKCSGALAATVLFRR